MNSKKTWNVFFIGLVLLLAASCNKDKKSKKLENIWAISTGTTPPNINPLGSSTVDATAVQSFALEGLMDADSDTLEWKPALAESYTVSEDGTEFTFKIRKGVTWHDGKPFTAEDVKFSYDIIFRDDYATQRIRPYFDNFDSPELIDEYTIKWKAKRKYHKNFDVLASGGFLTIVPKHIYDKPADKKALNKVLIGTGPYILKELKRGKWALFEKNPNWWGRSVPHMSNKYAWDKVIVRFIKGETAEFENFKKGNLSYLGLTPEQYVKKTDGGNWGKDYKKVKTQNKSVKGYAFVGFNLKKPLFQSVKLRKALAHLMNRRLMIEKFFFDFSIPATGPLYQQNPYANPKVKPIEFDTKIALSLLREDGWKDSDNDQILDKVIDGKKTALSFTLLIPNKDWEKYFTIFKEDAKKAGVKVDLKVIEWNSFIKKLDERSFDTVALSWGGGSVNWDPKQVWHSDSAKGTGSNFISYSNTEVDKLIDEARVTLEKEKRIPILHKVYELIANDVPYIFLFNRQFETYAYQGNLERPKDTFVYEIGTSYWKVMK